MKALKITYYITTALLSLQMVMSAGMYFFKNDQISEAFTNLGFPAYIIYPLAIAKILGLIAIWTNYSKTLKEWAYAGFFFNFVLAFSAHLAATDGQFMGALIALILLFVSYFTGKK